MREFLQAGIELVGVAGARRDRRGADRALPRARRAGLRDYRVGLGDASLYPALLRRLGRRRRGARAAARPSSSRATSSAWSASSARSAAGRREAPSCSLRVPQLRGGADVLDDAPGPVADAVAGLRRVHALLPPAVAERVIFDLGLVARPRLLHGRGLRGLRPGARRAAGRRRALRRPARALRAPAARGRLRARRRPAAHRAGRRGARRRREPRQRPDDRRPARRAAGRHARPARRARRRHRPRCAPTTASCCSRTSASSRCARPTCRPTSRPAPPTSGSPARTCSSSSPSATSTSCSTSATARAAWSSRPSTGRDPAAEALRRLGVMRVATKYPQDRRRVLRAHRAPGGDRRGQGLGRARAADRPGRGDRRPHRDRHDAARERPRHPRGDRRLHRAADRQPGRPQAQGRRRSTTMLERLRAG